MTEAGGDCPPLTRTKAGGEGPVSWRKTDWRIWHVALKPRHAT